MALMSTPRRIEIEITSECNLRCRYCSHFSSEGDVGRDLPTADWLAFFDECGKAGIMEILLSGGEPFMRTDIKEIIAGIVKNRMRFSANSNGSFITPDLAQYIAETKRCNGIQISIDGHCAEIHDSCRGRGSFEKAIAGFKNLRAVGIEPNVRVTIHQGNIDYLPEITRFLLEDLKLPGFSTNAATYMGLLRQHTDTVQLNAAQFSRAMQVLVDLNEQYQGRISATAGPLAAAHFWHEMLDAANRGDEPHGGCGTLNSCGCARNTLAVRADGVFVSCHQIDGYEVGSIFNDSIAQAWRSEAMEQYRLRNSMSLETFEKCRSCRFLGYCRGGCPASIYSRTKDAFAPNDDDCLAAFLREGGQLPVLPKRAML